MDSGLFVRGLVIGFSIAAPVGPIGVLCIRRTLAHGRLAGFVSGLGAATADGLYGCVAGFGLTAVSGVLVSQQGWLRVVGGAFLLGLGARIFRARPARDGAAAAAPGLLAAYASTLGLTLTNPATILSFAAIFAGLGLGSAVAGYRDAAALVVGVFLGSALWWLVLSGVTGALRERLPPVALAWVNRVAGVIVAGFGAAALLSAVGPAP
jgi:threonine/homoserine/homoserine lactone efflux protein